ncbi:MAG: Rrf2 family transcriptional regulator [Treponema sp.]|nr:Rrf2 family transcriptional regulator [Treponema sp.]
MHVSNKLSIAIHCLISINEFGDEKKVTSELLAFSTGCNPVTIRNIISSLNKGGIIEVRFGTGGTKIAVPLKEISLYRICSVVEPDAVDKMIGIHNKPSSLCPVGKNIAPVLADAYGKIKRDLIESMKSITLDMLVDDFHSRLNQTAP